MGLYMPKGPPPQWKQKAPHTVEMMPYVQASIQGGESDPETGWHLQMTIAGIKTADRQLMIKRGLFNAAKHHGVSMYVETEAPDDGTYLVRYVAINKKHGQAHTVKTRGTDRSIWPYNPRAKKEK
jgi:hypothetical protein